MNLLGTCPILSEKEVISHIIATMNSACWAGPDRLRMIFWKNSVSQLSGPLSILFQKLLNEGFVPEVWKKSWVMPFYKGKASPTKVEKIFEKVICIYLESHFFNLSCFSNKEYGFRSNSSTTSNLIYTYDIVSISKYIDQGQAVDVVYFDFCKAFDKASSDLLLFQMLSYGIDS